MSYDFNALYQEYLSHPMIIKLGYTTLYDFHVQVTGSVNDSIDSDNDPDPQDLWLMEYMDNAIENDSQWYDNYVLS